MTLKSIRVIYIQSIRDYTFTFPKEGITLFVGDNSQGKSIITKTTESLLYGLITNPKERCSIICNKNPERWGEIIYTREDGLEFKAHIHEEAAQTYFELYNPTTGTRDKSYLSNKSLPKYLMLFGFHYNDTRGVSLNICDGDESILFFKNSYVTNSEILEPVLTDRKAKVAYDNLVEVIKYGMEGKKQLANKLAVAEQTLQMLKICDMEKEAYRLTELKYLHKNLSCIKLPEIRELKKVPRVELIDIPKPRLRNFVLPEVIEKNIHIVDVVTSAKEYYSVLQGICPTCERPLFEGEHVHGEDEV